MARKLPTYRCEGNCNTCNKAYFNHKGGYWSCDRNKTKGVLVISQNPTMRVYKDSEVSTL